MKIVDRIEIHYFRSIYTLSLSGNNNINIFIGGNDVGKSNILKSLNLFFNNTPDFEAPFNFIRDLSRLRETEARAAKGRATIWIRITFNNFLNWASLPKQFSIKRSWNRYSEQPSETIPKGIPPTTIARFLNKIQFQYIPAVRSRTIFSSYLSLLHDSLIDDEKAGVRESSDLLMQRINDSTEDMADRIHSGLGFESKIKVPEDIKELFSALDFSTRFGDHSIPLQFRGDGIQARHIPFILDFVARHSNKNHIWGYEEPENSLEMSQAFELARQFDEDFSNENQIFITTHSPAFYDLSGPHVSKWFVQTKNEGPRSEPVTTVESILKSAAADQRLGIAALVSDRARKLYEENRKLHDTIFVLSGKVRSAARAQVIVEGDTDQRILETAYEKLFPGEEPICEFVPATGVDNAASFISTVARIRSLSDVPIIGLVDNDHAGRRVDKKHFGKYKHRRGDTFRIIDQRRNIFFGLLPIPHEFAEISKLMTKLGGEGFSIPLSIEFMFPSDVIAAAIMVESLSLKDRYATAKDSELSLSVNLTDNYKTKLPGDCAYFAQEIVMSSKNEFSIWVDQLPPEDFGNFSLIFEGLRNMCEQPN